MHVIKGRTCTKFIVFSEHVLREVLKLHTHSWIFLLLQFSLTNINAARAVEMFLQALLTRASGYATTRNAKTLTVGHM